MSRTTTHSSSGRELFYRAPSGIMVVQCWKPIPRSAGDAVVLFETKYFFSRFVRTYDLPP